MNKVFPIFPAKAEVGRRFGEDFADQLPMRVKNMNPIPRARPDSAIAVAANAVRPALVDLQKTFAADHAAIVAHLKAANQPRRA